MIACQEVIVIESQLTYEKHALCKTNTYPGQLTTNYFHDTIGTLNENWHTYDSLSRSDCHQVAAHVWEAGFMQTNTYPGQPTTNYLQETIGTLNENWHACHSLLLSHHLWAANHRRETGLVLGTCIFYENVIHQKRSKIWENINYRRIITSNEVFADPSLPPLPDFKLHPLLTTILLAGVTSVYHRPHPLDTNWLQTEHSSPKGTQWYLSLKTPKHIWITESVEHYTAPKTCKNHSKSLQNTPQLCMNHWKCL